MDKEQALKLAEVVLRLPPPIGCCAGECSYCGADNYGVWPGETYNHTPNCPLDIARKAFDLEPPVYTVGS